MQAIELVAVVLGLACVWLTARQHIACWPTGLAMVLLYIVIFFRAKLYSDVLLQVAYVILQIYGWHAWLRGGPDRTPLVIGRLPLGHAVAWGAVGMCVTAALGATMHTYTDASFPWIDAAATVASLIAQWLMGRKVLESWLVWIGVDIVSIGLYLAKDLHLTAALYAVFLALATWGWFQWRNVWQKQATD
jgi:nicotinamide mononucleotide transporter